MKTSPEKKLKGCGVGLRSQHYPEITSGWPAMDWFEAISENYMDSGGRPLRFLEEIRERYPMALHGVALSIGSVDPLRLPYLERLKALADRIEPEIVSDHLCWASVEGHELHDLLPLPFTEEAMKHIVERVQRVQEFLGRKILLENVSSYVTYKHSVIPEWEFLREVARRSGCGILLDLNNVYVNARNHHFDPKTYVENIPAAFVGQFHLAGHTDKGDYLFDTHTGVIIDPVWDLYRQALKQMGPVPALIEWDEAIPDFETLSAEAEKARSIQTEILSAGVQPVPSQILPVNLSQETEARSLSEIQHAMRLEIEASATEHQPGALPLNPQGKATGLERLAVYAGGYTARIHEALKEVFPAVEHVLGEGVFSALAHDYSVHYDSRHYNLTFAGSRLPDYLSLWPAASELPFLPDLAALEWKIAMAFHAFDQPPADPARLAGLSLEDWEQARIVFQPSVALVQSAWPVLDIWNARKTPVNEIHIDLVDRPQNILVCRSGLDVLCRPVENAEAFLIGGLMEGKSLGEVFEELADETEVPLPVAEWFATWNRDGIISECRIEGAVK